MSLEQPRDVPEQWRAHFEKRGIDFTFRALHERTDPKVALNTLIRALTGTGVATQRVTESISGALGITAEKFYELRGSVMPEPFRLPSRASRLTRGERDAVLGVIDAILRAHDTAAQRDVAPVANKTPRSGRQEAGSSVTAPTSRSSGFSGLKPENPPLRPAEADFDNERGGEVITLPDPDDAADDDEREALDAAIAAHTEGRAAARAGKSEGRRIRDQHDADTEASDDIDPDAGEGHADQGARHRTAELRRRKHGPVQKIEEDRPVPGHPESAGHLDQRGGRSSAFWPRS